MRHSLRALLLLGLSLFAVHAHAQVEPPVYEPTPEELRLDSLRTNWEAEARLTSPFLVITVRRQSDGFVYDAEDQTEELARVWTDSPIVVRTPGLGQVLFVVDFDGEIPGARDRNALLIPADRSVSMMTSRGSGYTGPWGVTRHRIRILVCTEDGPSDRCETWEDASPLSGSAGLTLSVVGLPERGYYVPAPAPDTGGGSGGSGRARPDDDG